MDMETVAISKFKAVCLEMLQKVRTTGEPLLITKRGRPIARIFPPTPEQNSRDWFGTGRRTCRINGDIVSPLGADAWHAFTRGADGPEDPA
jgi:prevent-host-death family protein